LVTAADRSIRSALMVNGASAALHHPKRINLDGSTSDEEVDEKARGLAKERLAVLPHGHHERGKKPRHPPSGPTIPSAAARLSSLTTLIRIRPNMERTRQQRDGAPGGRCSRDSRRRRYGLRFGCVARSVMR
jgi:hypothetical protein